MINNSVNFTMFSLIPNWSNQQWHPFKSVERNVTVNNKEQVRKS